MSSKTSPYAKQRASNQKQYKRQLWTAYLQYTGGKPQSFSQFRKWVLENNYGWESRKNLFYRNPATIVPPPLSPPSSPRFYNPPKPWVSDYDYTKQTTRNPKYGTKASKKPKPRPWDRATIPITIPYNQTMTAQHRLPPPPTNDHDRFAIDHEGLTFDDRCYLHSIINPEQRFEEYNLVREKNLLLRNKSRYKNVIRDAQKWKTTIRYRRH